MTRYVLAEGTQVREEDFGLLFYTRSGPRLFFISSGDILDDNFFQGKATLDQWIKLRRTLLSIPDSSTAKLQGALEQLAEKGVIHEC
jgi:putative mycofactocin binding protein MftB